MLIEAVQCFEALSLLGNNPSDNEMTRIDRREGAAALTGVYDGALNSRHSLLGLSDHPSRASRNVLRLTLTRHINPLRINHQLLIFIGADCSGDRDRRQR